MLRVGFLPSDFNPMVLMLGEAEDVRALADVLRDFARTRKPLRLDQQGFVYGPAAPFTLGPATGTPGITVLADGGVMWCLDTHHALAYAEKLDALADPTLRAGSEMLECGSAEGIPVKVSRGEYTDEFLLPRS